MDNIVIGQETIIKGIVLSKGISVAPVCLFNEQRHNNRPIYKIPDSSIDDEVNRLHTAIDIVEGNLTKLYNKIKTKVGETAAQIFSAQKQILKDKQLIDKVEHLIHDKKYAADSAIIEVLEGFESLISAVDNKYIREKATDIGEIKRRIIDALCGITAALECEGFAHCQRGKNKIVVAEELTPSLTLFIDIDHTRGFVTEHGGIGSHAAILAKSLGIPAMSGIKGIHKLLFCGANIIIDAEEGFVIAWPSEETINKYLSKVSKPIVMNKAIATPPGFKVYSSITTASAFELDDCKSFDGIGLYRTEFEFISERRILNEDEQFERYSKVIKAMNGKPVYFRFLDAGGDKIFSFLNLPPEGNPYLGLRGARLLLAKPELFISQSRAIARASVFGSVNAMFPMVVDLVQFRKLKAAFFDAISDIKTGEIKLGLMFEVPSACLQADEILAEAEFASIGTNDLVQYLFAVDRNNELVASDYTVENPIFWKLFDVIVAAAQKHNRPLSVCGEIAAYSNHIKQLIDHNIRLFSVSSRLLSSVRIEIEKNIKLKNK